MSSPRGYIVLVPARRILVFGFCEQTIGSAGYQREPGDVCLRIIPVDIDHGCCARPQRWSSACGHCSRRPSRRHPSQHGALLGLKGTPMANCKDCGTQWDFKQTAPVGSFAPNKFGLYDMVGNVTNVTSCAITTARPRMARHGSAWIKGGDCSRRMLRGVSYVDPPDDPRSGVVHPHSGHRFRVFRYPRSVA